MAAIGLFMLVCGTLKSEFIIYRLMVHRSRILWGQGDAVHRFYQVSGLIIVALGALWALGLIWLDLFLAGIAIIVFESQAPPSVCQKVESCGTRSSRLSLG
jgi:hypothetical protein